MTKRRIKTIMLVVSILLVIVFAGVSYAAWNNLSTSDDKVTVNTGSTTSISITVGGTDSNGNNFYDNNLVLVPVGEVMNSAQEASEITLNIPVVVSGNHANVADLTCTVSNIAIKRISDDSQVNIEGVDTLISIVTATAIKLDSQGKATVQVTVSDLYNDARLANCYVQFTFNVTANAVSAA